MDDETYIAVVQIHVQPPIDTRAVVTTHTKVFPRDTSVKEVWLWAIKKRDGEYGVLASLEIRPNE